MRFCFFFCITASIFCTTGNSSDIVFCCAHTPCLLHLEVDQETSVTWIDSNTGQIPLCLSNGTCHISEKGLHFSANFSKDGLYIAIINETNYHAAEHYYLVYIYENCHQMPYDSPRHTGHKGTSFNWSMGLWLVKCSHNKTFFLPFVLDSAKSAPIIMTETAITIYISMIFLIVSLLTFLNVLITLNNKYKHYGV
ncbi:ORF23 protein [Canine mastadenovirus A]|nr:orf23 [Canine mastadenovirus A]